MRMLLCLQSGIIDLDKTANAYVKQKQTPWNSTIQLVDLYTNPNPRSFNDTHFP